MEAQRAVIGSLMIDQACAGEVFQTATAAMFSDQNMRKIFEAVRDLWGAGKVFDPVTVLAKAGNDQKDLDLLFIVSFHYLTVSVKFSTFSAPAGRSPVSFSYCFSKVLLILTSTVTYSGSLVFSSSICLW